MENMNDRDRTSILKGSGFITGIGWILAIISLFGYPFIFGVLGVVMGILATKRGSKAGLTLIAASIILMGVGLLFNRVIVNYTRHWIGI